MAWPSRSPISDIRDRRRTFRDASTERSFRHDGYATIPLLSADDVARIRAMHESLVDDEDDGQIRFDVVRSDRRVIRALTEALAPMWADVLGPVLDRHRVVFSTCVVKDPGDWSGMEPHDDRSYVDERRARSITIWVPLTDTSVGRDNGHLAILPHSEHLATGFGGTNIATWYAPYRSQIEPLMTPIDAPSGTAVIYDSRAVHGSPPNRSTARRPALVAVAVPEEEPLVHAIATGRRGRRLVAIDDRFHLDHSPLDLRRHVPDLPVIEVLRDPPIDVSPAALARLAGVADAALEPLADRPSNDATGHGRRSPRRRRLEGTPTSFVEAIEARCEALIATRATEDRPGGEAPDWLPDEVVDVSFVELAPGEGYVEPPSADGSPTYVLPLLTPALPAGIATVDAVAPFEMGLLVATDPDLPNQVFNDGPDPLPLVVVRTGRC